jgi:N6-L-threonylcarbamoyladenine synthase
MIIFACDTSCDETSIAILDGRRVLTSVVASQVELHKKWGGIVPDIARRAHKQNIDLVAKEALKRARKTWMDIDYIACTYGPGLAIALEVGLNYTKEKAIKYSIPFVPIDHMEGHLFSGLALNRNGKGKVSDKELSKKFPAFGLLVSGSHTDLLYVSSVRKFKLLGETLDDAAGEAYDKVARMLNLGYPGGPVIEYLALKVIRKSKIPSKKLKQQVLDEFQLPIPLQHTEDLNFSYSGLKTSCLYKIKAIRESSKYRKESEWVGRFALAYNLTVCKSLLVKLELAIQRFPKVKSLFIGGGVINNIFVIRALSKFCKKYNLELIYSVKKYRGDNAGMVGIAAYYRILNNSNIITSKKEIMRVDRDPRLRLGTKNK